MKIQDRYEVKEEELPSQETYNLWQRLGYQDVILETIKGD
jgi:hypothetical protein